MSILPFSGLVGIGIDMLSVPISVQDVAYTASGGVDNQSAPISRTIQGAVDPSNTRKMEFLFGGNVSDGDMLIYTEASLYVDDMYAAGASRKQSFITYAGTQYRVSDSRDWTGQTGSFIYLAKRHVSQNGGI